LSQFEPNRAGSEAILNRLLEIARTSALAEMASGIAHELNQPLGAIATYSQAGARLLDRPEPLVKRALEVFKLINTEAMSAGDGIRRMRRLFEQREPVRTRCQMRELVEELHPVFAMLATGVHAEVKVNISPALPEVFIDRPRIQHVLFSLVQNALEASADAAGEPFVTVDVTADRYSVETSITDSGRGIGSDDRDKIFRPFFTTKPRGTGLGLASSRALIEAHEGTIGFENRASAGCRFWFRLPILEASE
jgi:C4-dicarboxylate-specific signal transduction histidine kinase